jgi:hypothetical protein
MLLEGGKTAEALAAFEAVLKKEPNRLGATIGAARAADLAGDDGKAKAYWAKVSELSAQADAERPEAREAQAFLARSR